MNHIAFWGPDYRSQILWGCYFVFTWRSPGNGIVQGRISELDVFNFLNSYGLFLEVSFSWTSWL